MFEKERNIAKEVFNRIRPCRSIWMRSRKTLEVIYEINQQWVTIRTLITFWHQQYVEKVAEGTSDWAAFTKTYAEKDLPPVGLDKKQKRLNTGSG